MIQSFPHLELVDVRVPNNGEWVIHPEDEVIEASELGYVYPIVTPANAYNVYHLEDLKIPEGYEADGETLKDAFRVPAECSWALQPISMLANQYHGKPLGPHFERLCLRKIAPKTKRVVILESDDPAIVANYQGPSYQHGSQFTIRFEDRPL